MVRKCGIIQMGRFGWLQSLEMIPHMVLSMKLSETGDTLKANVHYGLTVDGVFYKKWLPNQLILTGSYGDSDRTYVIWKWLDKNGRELKSKVDSGSVENDDFKKFIAPE